MIIRALSLFQVSCNFCKLSLSSSEAEADNDVGGHSSMRRRRQPAVKGGFAEQNGFQIPSNGVPGWAGLGRAAEVWRGVSAYKLGRGKLGDWSLGFFVYFFCQSYMDRLRGIYLTWQWLPWPFQVGLKCARGNCGIIYRLK